MTLAVVYAPIGFLSGLSGVLFREFAFTLAIAVVISGFVAITLSPIMSAWVCPDKGHETRMIRWVNHRFERLVKKYGDMVDFSLQWRWQLVAGGAFFSLLIAPLYLFSLKELSPIEDTSSITMIVEAAPEASIEETVAGFTDAVDVMLSEPRPPIFGKASAQALDLAARSLFRPMNAT